MPTYEPPDTLYREPIRWERILVFISSTFSDMHAERDYLVKRVFPELREWCGRRKLRLVDVDLRWGVTEEDATRHQTVVQVCLQHIDRCRPFFLCFLGQRRGWVIRSGDVSEEALRIFPGLTERLGDISMTELEILHAVIDPLPSLPSAAEGLARTAPPEPAHALFYLRDHGYLRDLPPDPPFVRQVYSGEAPTERPDREHDDAQLRRWRERRIPETGRPVRLYLARWDPAASTPELAMPLRCPSADPAAIARWQHRWRTVGIIPPGLDLAEDPERLSHASEVNRHLTAGRLTGFLFEGTPLDQIILSDLKGAISARFPDRHEQSPATELEREQEQQDYFLAINTEHYIGRVDDFADLDAFVEDESRVLFVLTAPSGTGKSIRLANWIDRYRVRTRARPGHSLHYRFIGASDGSSMVASLLRSLALELYRGGKLPDEVPDDPLRLRRAWPEILRAAGQAGRTVIVLDGLNQLETRLRDLDWLPAHLPPGVKLIVSFRQDDEGAEDLVERYRQQGAHMSDVRPLIDLEDRRRLARAYLSEFLKDLGDAQLDALVSVAAAANPLYLKVALAEIRVFGAFENLSEHIRSTFGGSPLAAFHAVLDRLETDPAFSALPPRWIVPRLFGFLAHARLGLSVDELTDLALSDGPVFESTTTTVSSPSVSGRLVPQDARDAINLYLRQVRSFLARRDRRYDFFYEGFREASLQRYSGAVGDFVPRRPAEQWHAALARHFRAAANPDAATPWSGESIRPLRELAHHLLQARHLNDVQALYQDPAYLDAVCTAPASGFPAGRDGESPGILELLGSLQAAREVVDAAPEEAPPGLLLLLRNLLPLLTERSRLLRQLPATIAQELANYLDSTSSDATIAALELKAHVMARPGLLVRHRIGTSPTAAPGHTAEVTALITSPAGPWLLSGAADGTVGCWPTDANRPEWIVGAHAGRVTWLALSPDGRRGLSTGEDGSVILWDLRSGEARPLLPLPEQRRYRWRYASFCAFVDEDTILVERGAVLARVALGSEIELWHDRVMFSEIGTQEEAEQDWTPDAGRLVVGGNHRNARVCDGKTGDILTTVTTSGHIAALALSTDGSRLLTVDAQGRLAVFLVPSGRPLGAVQARRVYAMCRAAAGRSFYALDQFRGLVRIDADDGLSVQSLRSGAADAVHDEQPSRMVALADGHTLAVGLESGAIVLLSVDGGSSRRWGRARAVSRGVIFPEDQGALLVSGPSGPDEASIPTAVTVLLASGERVPARPVPHGHFVSGAALLDAETALTVDRGGTAVVWRHGEVARDHRIPGAAFTACTGWREAGLGVVGTADDTLFLLGLGAVARAIPFPSNERPGRPGIAAVAASGRPMRVFAVYGSGEVRYAGESEWTANPATLAGTAAALHRDNGWAASGSLDGWVHVWRCATGEMLRPIALHRGAVTALAFSDEGAILLSAGTDRLVYGIVPTTGRIALATMLSAPPVALLAEPGARLAVLDVEGNVRAFSHGAGE